jgi:topoisomerase-4 subunit A
MIAQTRKGVQILNLDENQEAAICVPAEGGDTVAVTGSYRKLLLFPRADLPEMTRGKGVRLQKFKDGQLTDAKLFNKADGLTWLDPAGRTRTETNLTEFFGERAGTGRVPPKGFPKNNKFGN